MLFTFKKNKIAVLPVTGVDEYLDEAFLAFNEEERSNLEDFV